VENSLWEKPWTCGSDRLHDDDDDDDDDYDYYYGNDDGKSP
jgi:hypothetical protein